MKIVEAGHVYDLRWIDGTPAEFPTNETPPNRLFFVNREGIAAHPGTQTQEVIRALIDRTKHCDNCLRWEGNDLIVHHLRIALTLHEARAIQRKTEKGILIPEGIPVADDGHFILSTQEA
jgi:hypothetical protein